eukprot:4761529-Amphidinium_carterae.1
MTTVFLILTCTLAAVRLHLPATVAALEVTSEVRTFGHEDHVVHILADVDMTSCTLQGLEQKACSKSTVNRMSTPWQHAMSRSRSPLTHGTLCQDTAYARIYVKGSINRIERISTLQNKLL